MSVARNTGFLFALLTIAVFEPGLPATEASWQRVGPHLVSIGTHGLDVDARGHGALPVVFEAGLGNALDAWDHVLPAVAAFAPVVAYSRSGLGRSEPGPQLHTAARAVAELHALLSALGVQRPIVLVGASYGGLLARLYTSTYPSEIAGLVLVEGVHEQQVKRFGELDPSYPAAFAKSFNDQLRGTPPPTAAEAAEIRETVRIQLAGAVDGLRPLPDIPIAAVTSMQSDPNAAFINGTPRGHDAWRAMHEEWVERSSNGLHLTTTHSGHHVQDEEPSLVVQAIEFVRSRAAIHSAGER
jgi:pimeloyl-ACP methyl ester carboxylesterase